jgi:hypothetical protein
LIGLYDILAAAALGQPPARPDGAVVGLDAFIRRIEKDQENWKSQKRWMVRLYQFARADRPGTGPICELWGQLKASRFKERVP